MPDNLWNLFIYIFIIYLVFFILYCRVGLFSYTKLLSKGALQFNKSFYIKNKKYINKSYL